MGRRQMIFTILWLIGLLAGIATALLNPQVHTPAAMCINLLFYQMTISLTLSNLIGFIGHVFKSDMVAEKIDWAKESHFHGSSFIL